MPEGKQGLEEQRGASHERSQGGRKPGALRGPLAQTHLMKWGRASDPKEGLSLM